MDLCLLATPFCLRTASSTRPNVSQRTSKSGHTNSYRLRDLNLVQPGDEVDQVDDLGKPIGGIEGLAEWAREQGIAPEPIEWTKQV